MVRFNMFPPWTATLSWWSSLCCRGINAPGRVSRSKRGQTKSRNVKWWDFSSNEFGFISIRCFLMSIAELHPRAVTQHIEIKGKVPHWRTLTGLFALVVSQCCESPEANLRVMKVTEGRGDGSAGLCSTNRRANLSGSGGRPGHLAISLTAVYF